jgi:Tfp pilus assembly protein PilF
MMFLLYRRHKIGNGSSPIGAFSTGCPSLCRPSRQGLSRLRFAFPGGSIIQFITGVSLAFATLACQTTSQKNETPHSLEKKILDSQLTLVQNSLDQGQPEKAHGILREALVKYPQDPVLHNFMGLAQLALQNPRRATEHFDKSFKLNPQVGTGLNYSSALIALGDYKQAIIRLKDLIKQAQSESYQYKERIYHNIGYALVKAHKNKNAMSWFQKAIEENPTYFPAHLELGRLYESMNQTVQAVQSLRRAHDYCLVCWEPVEQLVEVYVSQGQLVEANKLLVSYLKLDEVPETQRELARQSLRQAVGTRASHFSSPGNLGRALP